MIPAVSELLRLKKESPELELGPRIDVINEYLDTSIEEVDQIIQTLPNDGVATWDELNGLFLRTLKLQT